MRRVMVVVAVADVGLVAVASKTARLPNVERRVPSSYAVDVRLDTAVGFGVTRRARMCSSHSA